MNTLRQLKKINLNGTEELVFQCLEWCGTNEGIQIENSKYILITSTHTSTLTFNFSFYYNNEK